MDSRYGVRKECTAGMLTLQYSFLGLGNGDGDGELYLLPIHEQDFLSYLQARAYQSMVLSPDAAFQRPVIRCTHHSQNNSVWIV